MCTRHEGAGMVSVSNMPATCHVRICTMFPDGERKKMTKSAGDTYVASHELDAPDPARDEVELLDAVINVGLIVHDVLIGVVRGELPAHGLSLQQKG